MRRARRAAAVAVAGCALVAAGLAGPASKADPGSVSASVLSGPTPASLAAERLLRAAVDAPLTILRDARGLAHLVGTPAGHHLALPAGLTMAAGPEAAARAHLAAVGPLFGLLDAPREVQSVPDPAGILRAVGEDHIVRFQQLRAGLPVLGGDLAVVLDAAGALKSVTGETLPSVLQPEPAAGVGAAEARRTAEALVARDHPAAKASALRSSTPERWYLEPSLIGIPAVQHMPSGPVWRIEVTDRGAVRDMVLVDSRTGKVPLRLNMITHAATDQVVCDNANQPDPDPYGSDCTKPYARGATATKSGDVEVDTAFANTGHAIDFYRSKLGVDLVAMLGIDTKDGVGKKVRATVRFCPETTPCSATGGLLFSNAFWNGRGMYYGSNWAGSDDIVAHELTHGVTEKTSRLLYLYQSGAISEAMSDIFGELVDLADGVDGAGIQTPWSVGEDTPLTTLPLRNMANPTLTLPDPQPDRMTSPLYVADLLFMDSGGVHDNSGVGNKAAYLLAAGSGAEPNNQFNGYAVPSISRDKTAKLFYRAQRMLTSGADYADLAGVLNQACSDLKSQSPTVFKSTTCDAVRNAVLATEMAEQPTGLAAGAAAPDVGFCPTATGTRARILSDGFESFSSSRWALGGFWTLIADYAKTGVRSLYGVEPDYTTSTSVTLNPAQRIPRGVKTYLRFAHQYRLDAGPELTGPFYDGARVEYRVGSGSWAPVLGKGFAWENGPSRTIDPDGGTEYRAFGGDSRGYVSSRADVSSLAGKSIQLRWRLISDRQVSVDGWTLDDVYLFGCGGTKPSDVSTITATSKLKGWATVNWAAPVWAGDGGVTGYQVQRAGKPAFKVTKSTRSRGFSGLTSGKTYSLSVWPIAKGGLGPGRTVKIKVK